VADREYGFKANFGFGADTQSRTVLNEVISQVERLAAGLRELESRSGGFKLSVDSSDVEKGVNRISKTFGGLKREMGKSGSETEKMQGEFKALSAQLKAVHFGTTEDTAAFKKGRAEAERYITERPGRVVVKADGLAGGKGAVVTDGDDEAKAAARAALVEGAFGAAGETIVIEDLLPGEEMSVHVVTDGERWLTLPVSRDHKRIGDGDTGPNTGGMGAFAPVAVDPALMQRIQDEVIRPTIDGMRAEGCPYRGVLYAGLMIAPDGTPNLLEHNVRFGDPETQVLMSLLDGDLAALLASAARGSLDLGAVSVPDRHAVTVVLAAEGYPASPRKGDAIEGLGEAAEVQGARVFHAGTRLEGDRIVTSGGRVLGICGVGASCAEARRRAYQAAEHIRWPGMQLRRDIATTAVGA